MGKVLAITFTRFQCVEGIIPDRRRYIADVINDPGNDALHCIELGFDARCKFFCQLAYFGVIGLHLFCWSQIILQFRIYFCERKWFLCRKGREIRFTEGIARKPHVYHMRRFCPCADNDLVTPTVCVDFSVLRFGGKSQVEIFDFLTGSGGSEALRNHKAKDHLLNTFTCGNLLLKLITDIRPHVTCDGIVFSHRYHRTRQD